MLSVRDNIGFEYQFYFSPNRGLLIYSDWQLLLNQFCYWCSLLHTFKMQLQASEMLSKLLYICTTTKLHVWKRFT